MKKTATVARTAFDLDHVNRLRVPGIGIVSLALKARGGQTSKMHVPDWAPPAAGGGSDDFHFVPEFEAVTIEFELDDPFALVGEATLELFCRHVAKPLWTMKLEDLGEDGLVHGKHSLKWDGRVIRVKKQAGTVTADTVVHDLTQFEADTGIHADFPDGYITLERTPYKLKLTVKDAEDNQHLAAAWTYFHILVSSLVIELGPEAAIPGAGLFSGDRHAKDVAVYRTLTAGIPAAGGAPLKIFLPSNLYMVSRWYEGAAQKLGLPASFHSEMNDETGYSTYEKLWDDGPRIPIIAKVRLLASDAAVVQLELGPGAKALGNTPFLWDWVDDDENLGATQSQATPRAFLTDALDYYKNGTDPRHAKSDHTYPKGDNCHVDRGGKRGPNAEPIFPGQSGYSPRSPLKDADFPFKVERCEKRKWASRSYAWTSGDLVGRTGVLFRPSRMGGDSWRLAAYAGWDRTDKDAIALDTIDEPIQAAAAIKGETGPLEMWRELHVVRYIRKRNAIGDFIATSFALVRGAYREAYVELVDKLQPADNQVLAAPNYNADAEELLFAAGQAAINDESMVARGANHAASSAEFVVKTWAQFIARWQPAFVAANPGHPNPAAGTQVWLTNNGWSAATWTQTARDTVDAATEALLQRLPILDGARDGITIIHFNFTISLDDASLVPGGNHPGVTNGMALHVPGSSRHRSAFVFWNSRIDTFMHEIGHHLFLPHSQSAGGEQVERHDSADANCMMSYNRPRDSFCGLCQLRLRGWDAGPNSASASKLKKTSADNKKP
jgi:hypothetical protein